MDVFSRWGDGVNMGKRRRTNEGVILWGMTMVIVIISFLQVCLVEADNLQRPKPTVSVGKFGDHCTSEMMCSFEGSKCENRKCVCLPELVATNQVDKCGKEANLNESCFFNEQCEYLNDLTECRDGICTCRFERVGVINQFGKPECIVVQSPLAPEDYVPPTMIAILVVMCLMFIIICVVLRLFSRERWRENRTIFNTPNPRLMNVSLLRDSKHGDRRGSKSNPSRQASVGSLRVPHSPSLHGVRRNSKSGSNTSLKSIPKSPVGGGGMINSATTPILENVTVEIRNEKP